MGQAGACLDACAGAWLNWMVGMSCQVAALVAVVAVISLLSRKASPRFRYLLWCLVLLKLCLPPDLAFVTGIGQWLPIPSKLHEDRSLLDATPLDQSGSAGASFRSAAVQSSVSSQAVASPVQSRQASSPRLPFAQLLFVVWLAGVLAMAALLIRQHLRLRRLLSAGAPVEDPDVLEGFRRAQEIVGVRGRVGLMAAPGLTSPILVGLTSPRVALPTSALTNLPEDQLRPVMIHELTHLRRHDLWVNWVQVIVQAAYWFHPLVWLANLRLRSEREMIVDDAVLLHLGEDREAYGRSLVSILGQSARRHMVAPGYVGILETRGNLKHRLRRILDAGRKPSVRIGLVPAALLVALALVFIPQGSSESAATLPAQAKIPATQVQSETQGPSEEKPRRLVRFEEQGKFGFKDKTGRIVIEPTYDDAGDFAFGLAPVNLGAKRVVLGPGGHRTGGKWGYINEQGKVIVPLALTYAREFSDGLAQVFDEEGVRFIDTGGRTVLTVAGAEQAGDFSEGIAPVYVYRSVQGKGWQTSFFNRKGEKVFSVDGYAEEFHEGLAVLTVRDKGDPEAGKYGFIDRTGKVVIAPQFAEAFDFSEGLAAVRTEKTTVYRMGDHWGYVDRTGRYAISPRFNQAGPFVNGVALVHVGGEIISVHDAPPHWNGGEWLVIDKTGKVLKRSAEWIDIRNFVPDGQTTKDEIKELPKQGVQYVPQTRPAQAGGRGIRAVAPAIHYAQATANGSPGIVTTSVPQKVQSYQRGGSR